MKSKNYLKTIAVFMATLIVLLPVAFAEEFDRVYDGNGNLISNGKNYYAYNSLNQLVKVYNGSSADSSQLLESYLWHPLDERIVVKRVYHNGVLNYTVYYPTKEFVRIVNSSGTYDEVYVRDGENILAQVDTDGNKIAVHNDHLGSVSLLTNENGDVIEETFFSPYGEILEGGKTSRFDYEGKEFDSVVEDYDFGFRKYDPPIGFNQPDTVIPNVYDPQLLNRYSFERSNPYKYTDPDGHIACGGFCMGVAILIIKAITFSAKYPDLTVARAYLVRDAIDKIKELPEQKDNPPTKVQDSPDVCSLNTNVCKERDDQLDRFSKGKDNTEDPTQNLLDQATNIQASFDTTSRQTNSNLNRVSNQGGQIRITIDENGYVVTERISGTGRLSRADRLKKHKALAKASMDRAKGKYKKSRSKK